MPTTTTDRIEKQILVRAPRSKVWRALTNSEEFGAWFGVTITEPFTPGARMHGVITHKGYEGLIMEITIERMEPERVFSWRWHPYAHDSAVDYTSEPTTLVTFALQDAPDGTLLTVVESGFDRIPPARRAEAFRANEDGWEQQMKNIEEYVGKTA